MLTSVHLELLTFLSLVLWGGSDLFLFMYMGVGNQTLTSEREVRILNHLSTPSISGTFFSLRLHPWWYFFHVYVILMQLAVFVLFILEWNCRGIPLVKSCCPASLLHRWYWKDLSIDHAAYRCCCLCFHSARPGFIHYLLIIDIHWTLVRIWRRLFPCVSSMGVQGFQLHALMHTQADMEPWCNWSHPSLSLHTLISYLAQVYS